MGITATKLNDRILPVFPNDSHVKWIYANYYIKDTQNSVLQTLFSIITQNSQEVWYLNIFIYIIKPFLPNSLSLNQKYIQSNKEKNCTMVLNTNMSSYLSQKCIRSIYDQNICKYLFFEFFPHF